MILFTHAAIGAAAAEITKDPTAVFVLAFASHFVLDAIPHWDYHLRSARTDAAGEAHDLALGRDFLFDLLKIGADFVFGVALALYLFGSLTSPLSDLAVLFGIAGGVLPDFLQFMYFKLHREPLVILQKFHHRIHTEHKLRERWVVGFVMQALFVAAVFVAVKILI